MTTPWPPHNHRLWPPHDHPLTTPWSVKESIWQHCVLLRYNNVLLRHNCVLLRYIWGVLVRHKCVLLRQHYVLLKAQIENKRIEFKFVWVTTIWTPAWQPPLLRDSHCFCIGYNHWLQPLVITSHGDHVTFELCVFTYIWSHQDPTPRFHFAFALVITTGYNHWL